MRRRYSEKNRIKYRFKKYFAVLLCLALCLSSVGYERLTVVAEEGATEQEATLDEDGELEITPINDEEQPDEDNAGEEQNDTEQITPEESKSTETQTVESAETDTDTETETDTETNTDIETETDTEIDTDTETETDTEIETETDTETATEEEETTETEPTEDIVEKMLSDISACTKASELYALLTGEAYTEFTEYINDLTEEEQNNVQTALEQALSELFASSEFEWDDEDAKEYLYDKYPDLVPQTNTKKKTRAKVATKTISTDPKVEDNDYIYFDLALGNVTINDSKISGYVYVPITSESSENDSDSSTEEQYTAKLKEYTDNNKNIYVYQSNGSPSTELGNWTEEGLPSYEKVSYKNQLWGDYITNNTNVQDVIDNWDIAIKNSGRKETSNNITISGGGKYNITIDNIYSKAQLNSNSTVNGGIIYQPSSGGSATICFKGDNRFARIHYNANKDVGRITFAGDENATMTVADTKGNEGYNYWNSVIGSIDNSSLERSYGMYFESGIIYAGAIDSDQCSAIGGGGNGYGEIIISGGTITAVANSTGTAIGGGIGQSSAGGEASVTISGGKVYAYNFGNSGFASVPVAAIGGGSSSSSTGSDATINITGGTVYAESAGGTAIGGGSSATRDGGNVTVNISGGDVTAKSVKGTSLSAGAGIGGGTGGSGGSGGTATVTISGNAKVTTGSIGGGKTTAKSGNYLAGNATVTIEGGTIQGQIVMESDGGESGSFNMKGGTIDNTNISDYNPLKADGGALYIKNGTATISGGTIQNCTAISGGAGYIEYSGTDNALTMSGGTIQSCTATNGGALYIKTGTANIAGGTIESCSAENGGAIYIDYSDSGNALTMSSGTINNNKASVNGGAIYIKSSQASADGKNLVEITGGTITDNEAKGNGGAIAIETDKSETNVLIGNEDCKGSDITHSHPTISKNTALGDGGGIYLSQGTINMYCGSIESNKGDGNTDNDVTLDGGTFNKESGTVEKPPVVNDGQYITGNSDSNSEATIYYYQVNYIDQDDNDYKITTTVSTDVANKIEITLPSKNLKKTNCYIKGWSKSSGSDNTTVNYNTNEVIDLYDEFVSGKDTDTENTDIGDGTEISPYIINLYAVWEVEGYTSTNGETVTSSYEVTIPAEINIGKDNLQGTLDLTAKLTYFGHNENLYIHVSSANEFKLQEKSGSSQMSYELSESNTPLSNNGYLVASVTDSTKDTGFATNATYNWVKTLTAKITGPAYAGNYTDTLTFTVSQSASN